MATPNSLSITFSRRAATTALVAALALAACSSGGSSGGDKNPTNSTDPAARAAKATLAAGSSRAGGTVTDTAKHSSPYTGSWSGVQATTGKGDAHATISVPGLAPGAVELRWTGGNMYLSRLAAPTAVSSKAGFLSILLRDPSEPPWVKLPTGSGGGVVKLLGAAFDPAALLDLMAATGSTVAGTTSIGGKQVSDLRTKQTRALLGFWPNATADVFVDAHDRAVRVTITSSTGGLSYDLTDYGTKVDVSAPPKEDIQVKPSVATVDLAGPYATAASGTTSGVAWKLLRAPAVDGRVCWKWDATPGITQVVKDRPDGARCLTVPQANADPETTVQFPIDADGTGTYDALAVVLPNGVKALTLGFVGGTTRAAPVTSPFVFVGPNSPTLAYLGVTLADGTTLDCGAGSVSSVTDLRDPSLTTRAAAAPWACVAP